MLCGVAVDVADFLAFEVKAAGGSDVYGEVVQFVDYEVEVHGGRGADSPHGDGLTLLRVGECEAVVHPSRGEVRAGGSKVLLGYLNGLQGIQYFFYVIPCDGQEDRDSPRLAAYVHCEPRPNHGSAAWKVLLRRGIRTKG